MWKDRQKLTPKKLFWSWWRQRWRHGENLNIALYIHVYFISVHFSAMVQYIRNKCYALSHGPKHRLYQEFKFENLAWKLTEISPFKIQCCLLHNAINILARVTKLNTISDQDIGYVSWKFQRNRPSSCWDTALLSVSSAMPAQRGLLTHLCFRGTNIVLTAKRSYSRTLRRLQTILCDFWNLLQLLLRPKNA